MKNPLFVAIYRSRLLRRLRPLARTVLGFTRNIGRSGAVEWLVRSQAMPLNWRSSARAARILCFSYGHLNSVSKKRSIDAKGEPIPWYTYPAIEYIKQLDFSDKSVFEYGAGNSTVLWSRIAGRFDVIVIDGPARALTRLKCCRAARDYLNEGGLIILDNSDWLPESAAFLRSTGLLQVDMTGFAPLNAHTRTTSFFFDRRCSLRPKGDKQPMHGIGSLPYDWERLRSVPGPSVDVAGETLLGVEFDQRFSIDALDRRHAFRVLIYHLYETTTALAIIDEDAHRIVLDGHCIVKGKQRSKQLDEARWIQQMEYDELRAFVNRHPRRRYML
jgi:hypothetical protein